MLLKGQLIRLLSVPERAQGRADGGGEGGVLRGNEANAVEPGEESKAVLRLGKVGHKAGEDHSLAAAGPAGHDGSGADGLEDHVHNACGEIPGGGAVGYIAEVGGSDVQGQGGVTVAGDVAHREVNVVDVTLLGKLYDLVVLAGAAQPGAEPRQGTAAHAGATQVAHLFSPFRPD